MRKILAIALVGSTATGSARAMFAPASATGVPPRSSVTSFSTSAGEGLGLSLLTRQSSRSKLRTGTTLVDNPSPQRTTTLRTTLLLDYKIAARTTAILAIPHVYNESAAEFLRQRTNALGDVALYGKYALIEDKPLNPRRQLGVLAGIKLPTGSTSVKDSAGERLAMPQQPGSGTIDFVGGVTALYALSFGGLYGDATYKRNTRAAYTFGDSAAINAGMNVPVPQVEPLSVTMEVNGEFFRQDSSKHGGPGVLPDRRVRDTGATLVFATPGIQWRFSRRAAASFAVQWPVYQDLRGTQLESGPNFNVGIYARIGR